MLVSFFSLQTLTSRSLLARVLADDHPLVDLDLAARRRARRVPAGCRARRSWSRPCGRRRARPSGALGSRPATAPTARRACSAGPCPCVSVRNSPRKPISPRDGIRNSSRTRPRAVVDHLGHRALAACPSSSVTTPMKFLGHVDDHELDRLDASLLVVLAVMTSGLRDLQLEAFAAHHLDRIASCSSPRPDDLESSRGESVCSTRSATLPSSLLVEPLLDLARGDVLSFAARERRRVDAEDHRDRRLVDVERGSGCGVSTLVMRVADVDVVDAGQATISPAAASVTSTRFRPSNTKSSVTRVFSSDAVELRRRATTRRLLTRAVEDAADGEAADVLARSRGWRRAAAATSSGSPLGGGMCSTIASNSGLRFSPARRSRGCAMPSRATA